MWFHMATTGLGGVKAPSGYPAPLLPKAVRNVQLARFPSGNVANCSSTARMDKSVTVTVTETIREAQKDSRRPCDSMASSAFSAGDAF